MEKEEGFLVAFWGSLTPGVRQEVSAKWVDFDRDGKMDFAFISLNSFPYLFRQVQLGVFYNEMDPIHFPAGPIPSYCKGSLVFADLN